VSEALVEESLSAVFPPAAVSGLRSDSPLSALGLVPADLVALGDAIAASAAARGRSCILDDFALAQAVTVADLVDAVRSALTVR
jgi:hypothetical protein